MGSGIFRCDEHGALGVSSLFVSIGKIMHFWKQGIGSREDYWEVTILF
jgi:hypothetical protein